MTNWNQLKIQIQAIVDQLSPEFRKRLDICDNPKAFKDNDDNLIHRICLVNVKGLPQLVKLIIEEKIQHFIQPNSLGPFSSFQTAVKTITDPDSAFVDPLEYALVEPKKNRLVCDITAQTDRESILKKCRDYVETVPGTNSLRESIQIVAEELLMNAIKDAPYYYKAQYGEKKLADHIKGKVELGQLICGYDDDKVFVCAIDPFGSLDIQRMLGRLAETFAKEKITINDRTGEGAGLGIRMIIDHSCDFFVMVQKGKRTIVGSYLPRGLSLKKMQGLSKNIHLLSN